MKKNFGKFTSALLLLFFLTNGTGRQKVRRKFEKKKKVFSCELRGELSTRLIFLPAKKRSN